MSHVTQKLSFREKAGYAMSDVGTNFFFQSMILYQTRFYTDTVGLSAIAVGSMFLVLRLLDAVVDPVVGALSDRTNTRWGKFRPWVLWTALPYGFVFWLVYVTPNMGMEGKLIYAYLTYSLVMMIYSANNTPYSALMGVMTPDASERTSIASYRFVAAMIGQLLITALALPLVAKFGNGSSTSAHGWTVTMAIFGGAIIVLNLIAFSTTKERLAPPPGPKSSLRDDLKDVLTCRPWIAMFVLTLMVFTMLVIRGSSLNYFFQYYLDQHSLQHFLDKVGLASIGASGHATIWTSILGAFGLLVKPDASNAAAVSFSLFNTLSIVIQIPGIIVSKPLCDRFGRKAVFLVGMGITAVATLLVFFVTPTSITFLMALMILWPLGWGPTIPVLWVMIADVADFSEWKTGRRATGFMFAGVIFALKAGLGLGGALSGWLLAAYGFVPNVAQTAHALHGIRLSASVYATLPFVISLACLVMYPIGKALNLRIQDELVERRKATAPA